MPVPLQDLTADAMLELVAAAGPAGYVPSSGAEVAILLGLSRQGLVTREAEFPREKRVTYGQWRFRLRT